MAEIILSEDQEQMIVVEWLELNNLIFTAVPNNTYTTSWKQKVKNKRMGLRPGMTDLIIAIPKVGILFLEMKKTKRGVLSDHQKGWIKTLNECPGAAAHVAYGAEQAIGIVESYLPHPAKKRFKDAQLF